MLSINIEEMIFNFINIIILFVILRLFLFKPVMGIIEKRKQAIADSMNNAEALEADAKSLHAKYEADIAASRNEADTIINKAKGRAQEEYDKILAQAKIDADNVIANAKQEFEVQKRKEFEKMQESIVDIAILAAMKASEETVDEQKSKKLLQELVMKAGA